VGEGPAVKVVACDQGSEAWYQARLGIPTSSQFHRIITPTGKLSSQAPAYMYRLVAERLLKESMDDYLGHVQWAERGKLLEPDAVAQFEFANNVVLEPVGFVTTDNGQLGASPDRLIAGRLESVEIKCPSPWVHLQYLIEGPGNDYRPQVQGQLLVTDYEAVHFYSYHPRCPPAEFIAQRDAAYIRSMVSLLNMFLDQLEERLERCRALGAYVQTQRFETPLQAAFPEAGPDALQIILPD
jgi:hypothetical protein